MEYFIFRNNTIEPYFDAKDSGFSGYNDISFIPVEAATYIWFYQVPLKYDHSSLIAELSDYQNQISLLSQQIPDYKPFLIFTMVELYPIRYTDSDNQVAISIENFNTWCRELANNRSNIKIINFTEFISKYSLEQFLDWKYYFISQMGLSPRLASEFKAWFRFKLDSIQFKRKKCLVLDLDNTLWSGILGEDGVDGIKIGGDYPGKAFLYFQQAILELSKAGVILTICSKNNEQDVLDAWAKNPFILLQQEYISAYRINWRNKADNIKELAQELNIGLDSMVFIDDNPAERELVKQMLPMVTVPDFPQQPYKLPIFFQHLLNTYFKIYTLTKEDRAKTLQYKLNADRVREQQKFTDFNEYLKSLDIEINIQLCNEFNLPRIAQMTQKTNQFNLTTKRYTDSDIFRFLQAEWKIYCISVSDKFGDNGITGAIFLKPINGDYEIDSLLLSCRILGKGIEIVFIQTIINILWQKGAKQLRASYIPTKKNMQVADFYNKVGFCQIEARQDGTQIYVLSLDRAKQVEPYYRIIIK